MSCCCYKGRRWATTAATRRGAVPTRGAMVRMVWTAARDTAGLRGSGHRSCRRRWCRRWKRGTSQHRSARAPSPPRAASQHLRRRRVASQHPSSLPHDSSQHPVTVALHCSEALPVPVGCCGGTLTGQPALRWNTAVRWWRHCSEAPPTAVGVLRWSTTVSVLALQRNVAEVAMKGNRSSGEIAMKLRRGCNEAPWRSLELRRGYNEVPRWSLEAPGSRGADAGGAGGARGGEGVHPGPARARAGGAAPLPPPRQSECGYGGGGRRRRGGDAGAVHGGVWRTEPGARLGLLPVVPQMSLFDSSTEDETLSVSSCSQARCSYSASSDASAGSESSALVHIVSGDAVQAGTDVNQSYGSHSLLKKVSYAASNSSDECQSIDEVEKLRKELKETLVMYDKACDDLVHAKKKIQVLSNECSEEARKVENALRKEKILKQVAADEKAKHLEAINEVEQAKRSFTREAYSKHKAEMVGCIISLDKEKIVDAILSTSKNCRRYSKHEIELATDNFSEARKIGEGGYGNVYRCTLDHIEVAVKIIQQGSTDKTDEFLKEVEILSQLHHPNLVLLIGFCPEIGCLVYEYLENGSLEDQLLNNKRHEPLHWFLRFRIIFEVSCGLAFLHGRKPEPVVHRDLKPANILLDKNYVGKIGDAGFAKLISDLVPDWQTEYTDTIVAGTMYYMDPEYQQTGTVRPKSDLFGLGVIILQMLTGKCPNGLIASVENAVKSRSLAYILDKSQTDWPVAEAEMLAKLGLRCTALKCRDRPDLESEVLPELEEILHRVASIVNKRNLNSRAPIHFICPITQGVMDDPYVAADGHTYEHHAIKDWLRKNRVSPITRCKLPNLSIIPNHSLHAAIQQWKKSQPAQTQPWR